MRRALERLGLLPLVSLVFGALALALQAGSSLPWSYSWWRPLQILKGVALGEGFPVLVTLALLLGRASRWSRTEAAQAPHALRLWLSALGRRQGWSALRALAPLCLLYAAAGLASANYGLLDWLLLAPLGLWCSALRFRGAAARRAFAEFALIMGIFTVISYGFTVIKAALFLDRVPHDASVIALEEQLFGFVPHRVLAAWAGKHPELVLGLDRIYYRLFEHMGLVSVFLTAAGRRRERVEYLAALALCYVVGGLAYHAWPVLGPVFWEPNHFAALREQELITNYFQAALLENTRAAQAGSLKVLSSYDFIAGLPSLHMAHEFVMLYHARHSRWFFAASAIFTGFTLLGIVVLGWHYPSDALAGLLLSWLAISLARSARGWLLPHGVMPEADARSS